MFNGHHGNSKWIRNGTIGELGTSKSFDSFEMVDFVAQILHLRPQWNRSGSAIYLGSAPRYVARSSQSAARLKWSQAGELLCEHNILSYEIVLLEGLNQDIKSTRKAWGPLIFFQTRSSTGLMVSGTIPWETFSCSAAWTASLCCVD